MQSKPQSCCPDTREHPQTEPPQAPGGDRPLHPCASQDSKGSFQASDPGRPELFSSVKSRPCWTRCPRDREAADARPFLVLVKPLKGLSSEWRQGV